MFSNLSKGSVLYGLDKRDGVTLFTATVDNVSIALPNMMNMPLGQTMLNIKATVNGKQGDFLNIPSTNICKCCKGQILTIDGYIFLYKGEIC